MTVYALHFDRIGRGHRDTWLVVDLDPEPAATVADRLAELVFDHARPKVLSQDVNVAVELDLDTGAGKGIVSCGWHSAGNFTVELGRRLIYVEPRAAGRGQSGRNRLHLVAPELMPGGYRHLGRALCGAEPEHGFYEPTPERLARGLDNFRACPRCVAKVRPTDLVDQPAP